ncbi:mucoidy inhibitor MuiA family protein [Nannocystaceae bacterium ST9]
MTVFRRGAQVTREAELHPGPSGLPTRVQIAGLPLALDDASLRIEVVGEGPLPVAADLRVTLAVPSDDPTLPAPDDAELEQAELAQAQVQRELERLQQALANLARLEPGARGEAKLGQAPQPSPLAARLELLGFRRARADALITKIGSLDERVRLANERVASLRERKRVASQARNVRTFEVRKAAVITLEPRGTPSGSLRLRLSYFVAGARWAPAYTVRLDRSMRAATLELRAMVGQSSGEDWTDVALVLSTASPQQWTELPELRAQKIGRAQPEPAKTGWRAPPIGAGELYADYDRDLGERRIAGLPPPMTTRGGALPSSVREDVLDDDDDDDDLDFEAQRQSMTQAGTIQRLIDMPPPRPSAPPPPPSYAPPSNYPVAPGAMPMPMPTQSMPAPQSMAMPKRSAGFGARARSAMDGAFAGGMVHADESIALDDLLEAPADEAPELVAGRELLDYGRLRLFAASDSKRGALRRVEQRVVYQQLIASSVQFDVAFAQLDVSLGRARRFEAEAAPARYRYPEGEAGFDYAYVADGSVDLPSDGKFHSLAIRADAAEATPRYVSVPRESQDVFRIVALRNPLNAPLLPGPADVYVAGRFALTSDVELTPIGGRLELGLGVEQAIKIARNVKYDEDTAGLIKRQHALIHAVEITIGNNLSTSATVEVRERLPHVPSGLEGDIQVAVRDVRPAWADYEQKSAPIEGGRMWTIEVPAGDERKLQATWVITIPNQHELIGGNRRES